MQVKEKKSCKQYNTVPVVVCIYVVGVLESVSIMSDVVVSKHHPHHIFIFITVLIILQVLVQLL